MPSEIALNRRLHTLDVAAVIGAPHIDHRQKAAVDLVLVIGNIGGKIRVAAVGFLQRPVDIVAELRRAEQRLLAIFPVFDRRSFRRRQPAFVNVAGVAKLFDCRGNLVRRRRRDRRTSLFDETAAGKHHFEIEFAFDQRAFRKKHVMHDAKRHQVVADFRDHHVDGAFAHDRQPFGLGLLL